MMSMTSICCVVKGIELGGDGRGNPRRTRRDTKENEERRGAGLAAARLRNIRHDSLGQVLDGQGLEPDAAEAAQDGQEEALAATLDAQAFVLDVTEDTLNNAPSIDLSQLPMFIDPKLVNWETLIDFWDSVS